MAAWDFCAELALIQVRSVGGYEFAQSGTQRRGFMHNAMREAREVRRHFGPEGKKVPDLPVVWAWLRIILNVWKKHGLHFHGLHNCS